MLDYRTNTFLTVCTEMNFTRAAQKLHISQPAVSQHIQYIEEYYGVKLFEFEGKKIYLTDAGKLLRKSLTALNNNEIYLKEELSSIADKKKYLRFGCTLTVGEYLISKPLIRFLLCHNTSEIAVTVANTAELLQKLDVGEIDFAVVEGDYPKTLYNHQTYMADDFIAVCGRDYTFRRQPEEIGDITGERLILREPGSGTRRILERTLIENGISLEDFSNIVTIGNMHAIKDIVTAGCGITFLYETAVKKEIEEGAILKIRLNNLSVRHDISVVWKKDTLFEDSFRELFQELFPPQSPEVNC